MPPATTTTTTTTLAPQQRHNKNTNTTNSNNSSVLYLFLSLLLTLFETVTIMPPCAQAFSSSTSSRTSLATATPAAGFFSSSSASITTKTTSTTTTATTSTTTALGLQHRRMGPSSSSSSSSKRQRLGHFLPPPFLQRRFGNENNNCPDLLCIDCPPIPDHLLVCRVISGPASVDTAAGGSSDDEPKKEVFFDSAQVQKPWWKRRPLPWSSLSSSSSSSSWSSWKDELVKVSNFASALCVIDCTVLPLVTIILPLFGLVAASPVQLEWLHELGHQVALYFVLPVGTLATTLNYSNHGKWHIASLGGMGLLAIVLANGGCHFVIPHHSFPGPFGHALHELTHLLHHGIMHRVTNLTGCFLLLLSNYLSRRQKGSAGAGASCHDPACNRNH